MAMNRTFRKPEELPAIIPVFPLPRALLLPRVELPLNIFEPRYLAMVDDALKSDRIIGMIQPDETREAAGLPAPLYPVGCAGRITQLAETGDGRYQLVLTGIARFRVKTELSTDRPYRQCEADFAHFATDLVPRLGEDEVDRETLLKTLANYLAANSIEADWSGISDAPTEALVNGLSLMAPFGVREKQALLEAGDLRSRAELLVAATEIALAAGDSEENGTLQ
jgi:Lon protease-like protein